jgi:hypothetical protein
VAVANARDNNHDVAMDLLETSSGDLLVLPTVVAETCYMLGRFSSAAGAAFLRDFDDGPLDLTDLTVPDLDRMAELVEQYADFPSPPLIGGISVRSALCTSTPSTCSPTRNSATRQAGPGIRPDP